MGVKNCWCVEAGAGFTNSKTSTQSPGPKGSGYFFVPSGRMLDAAKQMAERVGVGGSRRSRAATQRRFKYLGFPIDIVSLSGILQQSNPIRIRAVVFLGVRNVFWKFWCSHSGRNSG